MIEDTKAIRTLVGEEAAARCDRLQAFRLTSKDANPTRKTEQYAGGIDSHQLDNPPGFNGAPSASEKLPDAESTACAKKEHSHESTSLCLGCVEEFPRNELALCPCLHTYCRECLTQIFQTATVNEALFPPRCCRYSLQLDDYKHFFTDEFIKSFKAKEAELLTIARMYCHVPQCSAFVPPKFVQDDVATCQKCEARTCAYCLGEAHDGDCPEDPDTQGVYDLADEYGWQQCTDCGRVVDLDVGCNHIFCPCGAEFCYVCGAPWKTCRCPQWDEDRLTERAEEVAERDQGYLHMNVRQRHERVEEERQHLFVNHDCPRHRWIESKGPYMCDGCFNNVRDFIFCCAYCHTMSCKRCRFHRFA